MRQIAGNKTQNENRSHENSKCFSPDESKGRPLRSDQSLAILELRKNSAGRPCSQYKHQTANDWSVQELDSLEDRESTQLPP